LTVIPSSNHLKYKIGKKIVKEHGYSEADV
jgi:hypothetical protein